MKKPASLRAAIAAAIPDLAANPDRFLVFVDAGTVTAFNSTSLSFDYQYTLNLILTDYAGDPDQVFLPLLAWVHANQSELLANDDKRRKGIEFEVDHLNHTTCDISIKLALEESVLVQINAEGVQTITHLDEPVPEWERTGLA